MTDATSGRERPQAWRAAARRDPARRPAREPLVRGGERQVREGTSVVILGAPGSGRTYLASRIVASVPDLRVIAVRSATSAPGLIVSTVHDPSQEVPSGSVRQPGTVRRLPSAEVGADDLTGPPGTTVVLADDAHLLDLDHLTMLCDLASDRRIVLLATSDTAATTVAACEAAVSLLTTLWLDGGAGRIDLTALSETEGHELVRSVAGPRRLDLAVRHAILVASGGSPVTIRELTLEALRSDPASITRDLLGRRGLPHLPPRVVERARRRLAGLSPVERDALVLLSRLDAFDPERAVRYVGDATLRRLVQHGCVTSADTGSSALRAAPVDAEAVLSDGSAGTGHGPLVRALRSMVDLDTAGLALEPFECLLLSDSWVESADGPQGPTPAATPTQVSRIATAAARKSTAMLQPYRALSHALLALDAAPTGSAAVEASRALAALGSVQAARDVLGRVPDGTAGVELELVALWRAELEDWGAAAPDGPVARSVETLRGAVHALRSMRWREALGLARGLADDETAGLVPRLRACAVAGTAAAFLGLGAELTTVTTTGRRLHARLVAQSGWTSGQSGWASAQLAVDEGAVFHAASTGAHLTCSIGWVDISARLDALMQRAVAARDLAHTSTLSALAGCVALAAGDGTTAGMELDAALDRAPRPASHETLAWLQATRATALARLGRTDEAEALCAALEAPGATESTWSRHLVETVRRAVGPSTSGAVPPPRALDPDEAARHPTIALLAAAEAASTHDGTVPRQDLVDAVTVARGQTDIGSLHAVADYVIAASTSDAASLADLTRTFDGLGMRHLADACEEQARRLLDPDSPHALSAWRDRANRDETDGTDEALTAREREVAVLAGRGLSNREIASRLFLSVRTVESHLYLARRKLGAASRRDLASRLADEGDG